MNAKKSFTSLPAFLHRVVWPKTFAYLLFFGTCILTEQLYKKAGEDVQNVVVVVELKALKTDVFQLFYRPVNDAYFSQSRSVKKLVQGKASFQFISFEIASLDQVEQVRLDLGSNPRQKTVEINQVLMLYKKDTVTLFEGDWENCFSPNDNVSFVGNSSCKLDLNKEGKYDPFICSGGLRTDYDNLTAGRDKLPGFLLLPAVISLFIYLFFLAGHNNFLTSFQAFASCFFILLLLLPILNNYFDLSKDQNREKKILAEKPLFNREGISDYPNKFEDYYNDHFGFRSLLIKLVGKLKYHFFATSVAPAITTVGKMGWMYYSESLDKGGVPLSDTTLERVVKEQEAIRCNLDKEGIKYYLTIWPEKQAIYPEYLPQYIKMWINDTVLKVNQIAYLLKNKKSPLRVIDVTKFLKDGKRQEQVYHKYDSHWNAAGAFAGYTGLMSRLYEDFPQLISHGLLEFEVSHRLYRGGDLADPIGIPGTEEIPVFKLKNDSSKMRELPSYLYPLNTVIYENTSASTQLSVLIYGDSFTINLMPFLKPHFRKIIFLLRQPFKYKFINNEKPDIVIKAQVSRYVGQE